MKKNVIIKILAVCAIATVLAGCGQADNKMVENTDTVEIEVSEDNELSEVLEDTLEELDEEDVAETEDVLQEANETKEVNAYDNWWQAYSDFLMDNNNFEAWLSTGTSYREIAIEASYISGFTVMDIDNNDVPELIVLAQAGWDTNVLENLIIYTFDENTGEIVYKDTVPSCGSQVESYSGLKGVVDNNIITVVNDNTCLAGVDKDGQLVVFKNYSGAMCDDDFAIFKYDLDDEKYNTIYSFSIFEGQILEMGDLDEAKSVLDSYSPIMFFDIDEDNINNLVKEDYSKDKSVSYSADNVISYLADKSNAYNILNKDQIAIDGMVDSCIAYNCEYMMQWDCKNTIYYNERKGFSDKSNEYTDLISSDLDKISMVVDLDRDGEDEAFVCEVFGTYEITYSGVSTEITLEKPAKVYEIENMYYIDENKNVQALEDYKGVDILGDQYAVYKHTMTDSYDGTYITINGYNGMDRVGKIFTVKDNVLCDVTSNLLFQGHKYFANKDEIVWYFNNYSRIFDFEEGKSFGECVGIGRTIMPYYYKLDKYNLGEYSAKEISADSDKIDASVVEKYKDAKAVNYIYRDNGELDVTYAVEDSYGATFSSDIYFIKDGKTYYSNTVDGIYYVNCKTGEINWNYLKEKH